VKVDWPTSRLDQIATIGAGSPAPQDGRLFESGTHPFFRTADAGQIRFGVIVEAEDNLNAEGIRGLRPHPKGTILFPKSGASTFLNHRVMLGVDGYVSSHLATIAADERRAIPSFLLYFLSTVRAQDLVQDQSYPSLNLPAIGRIMVPVPPLAEQRRIVVVLDEAFAAIATAKANTEKNLANALAVFESQQQALLANAGHGSKVHSVGDLVDAGVLAKPQDGNHGEIHPVRSDFVELGVPFIMAADLQNGSVNTRDCRFITQKQAAGLRVGFSKDGDVLLSHKGTIGRVAILKTNDEYVVLTPQVTYYRILDPTKLSSAYLSAYFLGPDFQKALGTIAEGGSTRAYIGITRQLSLTIVVPPLQTQTLVAGQLASLSAETQRLESLAQQKLAALDALKASLLHHAFTGQLSGQSSKELVDAG
jgi:type I restriction enzyme, S subunit